MSHDLDIRKVHESLAQEWGAEALELDEAEDSIYFHFDGEIPTYHKIDARTGAVQGYAEVTSAGTTASGEDLFELANKLNMAICHDLGLSMNVHVFGHGLHLSDTRPIDDLDGLVETCTTQSLQLPQLAAALREQVGMTSARGGQAEAAHPEIAV